MKKTGLLFAILPVLCASMVYASYSQTGNEITVTGDLGKPRIEFCVDVYKKNITHKDYVQLGNNKEDLFYRNQGKTNRDGEYTFCVGFEETSPSGLYCVYVIGENGEKSEQVLQYINADENKIALDLLIEAAKEPLATNFCDIVENNRDALGFNHTDYENTNKTAISTQLYNIFKDTDIDDTDTSGCIKLYSKCVIFEAINEGLIDNIFTYTDLFDLKSTDIALYFESSFFDEAMQKKITAQIAEKNYAYIKDMETDLAGFLILDVVENPNGYANITDVIKHYASLIGVDESKINDELSQKLVGSYSDLQALKLKIEEMNKPNNPDQNNHSGNNGSRSGGSGSGGGGKAIVNLSQNTEDKNTTIPKDIFSDLDSVEWAKTAIVELAQLGIISGKEDGTFCPNDLVTREEFTKMVVEAFAGQSEPATLEFSDVNEKAWYAPYIAKAYGAGIVNGKTENCFGIAEKITRQDMVAIINNAARFAKISLKAPEEYQKFKDDEQIAGYVKEAIYTLREAGIINGVGDGSFSPLGYATRAQAAVIIYALMTV